MASEWQALPRAKPVDTTGNAIYNLAVHHQTRSNPDAARDHFRKVIDEYPDTHWAQYARKRMADLPEPTDDTQPEQ